MQELITRSWNGFNIEFELIDGQLMANATAMCDAFGKRPSHWLDLVQTKRYLAALEAKPGIPAALVETRNGGTGGGGGTWIHERLIMKLAQWLNVDFEVQCDEWVAELLRTGQVALAPVLSPAEMLLQQCQQLVDHERRMKQIEAERESDRKQLAAVEQQVAEVVAKQTTIDTSSYSIAGYATLHKIKLTPQTANGFGRRASTMSKEQGYPTGHVHDARYGQVGTYHVDILKQVFAVPTVALVRVPAHTARRA